MRRLTLAAGAESDLPELTAERVREVLDDFRDRVTAVALANAGNRAWWYSWASSRDRYHCPLAADLEWLARVQAWLAAQGGEAALDCPDPVRAEVLATWAEDAGWRVTRPVGARLRWAARRCAGRLRTGTDAFKALGVGLLSWWAARRHPRRDLGGHDVILVAWLDRRLLSGRRFESVYFGPLAALLEQAGERCLHLGPVMADPRRIGPVTRAAAVADARVATIGHLLTLGDVLGAVGAALVERVRLPASDRALMDRALYRRVIYSAQARMIERATARALALNPNARVIRIYENLPWERAVDFAARAAGRDVTGYLHCAVLPSHLNYFLDEREVAVRPAPHRIVCTGPAARDVLLGLGHHDPARVLPGMALRGPDPATVAVKVGRPDGIRTVLVLLEGLYKMVPLLRVLAASEAPRLVVRAHPMLPLEVLAEAAGVACGPGTRLEKSEAATLEDAVAGADAVLYQGTTAALTAGLMGVPLIRFDDGQPLSDDPLVRCAAFKREFHDAAGLAWAAAALESLSDADWAAERDALRAYVADYLRAPSAEGLADFRVARRPSPAAE